jgi:flavin reductase (DIM6/NTAB) family NADH-FMN oxidoreductase RutF
LVIGEITDVFINESVVLEDGFIDLEKANSISCLGLDAYFTTNRIARFGYAKPDMPVKEL